MTRRGGLHHVELWVPDLARAEASWGWLLGELGWTPERRWAEGATWVRGDAYVTIESGPDVVDGPHERTRPGVNHLAFWAGSAADLDALVAASAERGWRLLYADRHPYAGGARHRAAYLEDADGYEVELVTDDDVSGR